MIQLNKLNGRELLKSKRISIFIVTQFLKININLINTSLSHDIPLAQPIDDKTFNLFSFVFSRLTIYFIAVEWLVIMLQDILAY